MLVTISNLNRQALSFARGLCSYFPHCTQQRHKLMIVLDLTQILLQTFCSSILHRESLIELDPPSLREVPNGVLAVVIKIPICLRCLQLT